MTPTREDIFKTTDEMANVWSKLGEQVSLVLAERELIKQLLLDDLFPESKEWTNATNSVVERVDLLKTFYLAKQDQVKELEAEHGPMWPNHATVKIRWVGPADSYRPPVGWAKRDDQGKLVSAYSGLPLSPECWEVIEERAA